MAYNIVSKRENLKMAKVARNGAVDVLIAVLTALTVSVVAILMFAAVLTFVDLSGRGVDIVVTVIKVVSVLLGVVIGVRSAKGGAVKGLIIGLVYVATCYLSVCVSTGEYLPQLTFWIDGAIVLLASLIGGIVVVNTGGR